MNLERINEGTTAYLTFVPKDKNGVAQTPSACTWRAIDVESGQVLQADTSITPAASVEITLTPAINTLFNPQQAAETRRVTVIATYGTSDAAVGVYEYQVDRVK